MQSTAISDMARTLSTLTAIMSATQTFAVALPVLSSVTSANTGQEGSKVLTGAQEFQGQKIEVSKTTS
jgi:hypothetical protein